MWRREEGEEGEGEEREWSPRGEQQRQRRSFSWDDRGAFFDSDEARAAASPAARAAAKRRGAGAPPGRAPAPTGQRPQQQQPTWRGERGERDDRSGGARRRADTARERPGFGDLNLSGVARRLREKTLRAEGRLLSGDLAPPPPRQQPRQPPPDKRRTAKPWEARVSATVQQQRDANAAVAALPLPLPPAQPAHDNPFIRLGLSQAAGEGLQAAGMASPTTIQTLALPQLLRGDCAALLAETGSGKTLAYCLPILTRLYAFAGAGRASALRRIPATACPEALLIVPTRELGLQVANTATAAAIWCCPDGAQREACVLPILGKDKEVLGAVRAHGGRKNAGPPPQGEQGDATQAQLAAFEAADVVVCTPRAALNMLKAGRLRLGRCRAVVVDEADELLSEGFSADVRQLLASCVRADGLGVFGQQVQVVFAAATMGRAEWDTRIRAAFPGKLARIASPGLHRAAPGLQQRVLLVQGEEQRTAALLAALEDVDVGGAGEQGGVAPGMPALVFASSPDEADAVAALLQAQGLPAAAFHGKVKGGRGELLDDLQAGLLAVLVVTDVAARGLDLPQVRNVVQWRPAPSAALHLHRVGRTGRAGAPGVCQASTLVDPEDTLDAKLGATPLLIRAAQLGWDQVGELIDTSRRE